MASLREEAELRNGVTRFRALLRAAFAAMAFAVASLAMLPAANAQFVCTTDPNAPGDNQTCINNGVEPLVFNNTTVAGGAATSINNGTSAAIQTFTQTGATPLSSILES